MAPPDQRSGMHDDAQSGASRRFAISGLELLGLEADEAELAVIDAVDTLYRPLIEALLEAELDGIEPEPGADVSRGPQTLESR